MIIKSKLPTNDEIKDDLSIFYQKNLRFLQYNLDITLTNKIRRKYRF